MPQPTFLEAVKAIALHWAWFWPLVGGIFGSVMGSFLECAAYRIPRGISMRQPPSQCPSCHTRLGVPDLVPVFSYLALRGHCRHCNAPIGRKALVLEVVSTILGILLACFIQASFLIPNS